MLLVWENCGTNREQLIHSLFNLLGRILRQSDKMCIFIFVLLYNLNKCSLKMEQTEDTLQLKLCVEKIYVFERIIRSTPFNYANELNERQSRQYWGESIVLHRSMFGAHKKNTRIHNNLCCHSRKVVIRFGPYVYECNVFGLNFEHVLKLQSMRLYDSLVWLETCHRDSW